MQIRCPRWRSAGGLHESFSEDFANGRMLSAHLDEYSSADSFTGWTLEFAAHPTHVPLPVAPPQSWLLREGWKRFGAIDPQECPGPLW